MKNTIKISLLVCLIYNNSDLFGQTRKLLDPNNTTIYNKCIEVQDEGFNWWKCNELQCGQLFTTYKQYTGLGADDQMIPIKTWEDSVTLVQHVKYQQFYKGILMENVQYVEHSLNCDVMLTNGFVCERMNKSSEVVWNESSSLQKAIEHIGIDRVFAWQDDTLQYYLTHDSESSYTTYYPTGELLWAHIGDNQIVAENFKLAWKFRIWAIDSPMTLKYVYIDAITGSVLKDPNVSVDGTFNHLYYGQKNIDTRYFGGARRKYFLETDDNGMNISTKDKDYHKTWKLSGLPDDKDDNWGNDHWAATASHWVTQESWDYWKNIWQRHGIDNNWRPIKVLADIPEFNAYYTPNMFGSGADALSFGRFDIGLSASLDIGGHEYTHGITYYSAGLIYQNESGALNESYSDIFGFLTERYHFGFRNWTIGEDASNVIIRNIQNPKGTIPFDPSGCLPSEYPNFYLESGDWHSGSCDNGGVHHNSAVQNRCFYLLSMGGTQLGITVGGIGIDKAARIAEYALVNGLVLPTTNYTQNRASWVAAAKILFGDCSTEKLQTCRAWASCNIGTSCPCPTPPYVFELCWSDRYRNIQAFTTIKDIESIVNEGVTFYPNPTEGIVNLNFEGLENSLLESDKSIKIINLYGQEIKQIELTKQYSKYELDIENLNSGTYFLIINIGNNSFQYKLIKN